MNSVLHSVDLEWEWHRPLLGPSYRTHSFQSITVVSDFPAPLSEIQVRYPSSVQRVLDGISQLSTRGDWRDWEIYFLGVACVYVNHPIKILSVPGQSLDEFVLQVERWGDWEYRYGPAADKRKRMKMEQAYWAYLRSHTNHYNVPDEAVDEALEQLGTSYNMALFEWNQPTFIPRPQAALWIEMLSAVRDLPDKRLRVYLVASAMHEYSEYSEIKHYGPEPSNRPNFFRTLSRFILVWIFGFVIATLAITLLRPHRSLVP